MWFNKDGHFDKGVKLPQGGVQHDRQETLL
jgi:hypothetical protein